MWLLPSPAFGLLAPTLFLGMRTYERLDRVERQTDTSNAAGVPTAWRAGLRNRSA